MAPRSLCPWAHQLLHLSAEHLHLPPEMQPSNRVTWDQSSWGGRNSRFTGKPVVVYDNEVSMRACGAVGSAHDWQS